jgi:DNA polymerase
LITLDFETYYDKDYTLKKLTTEEYVRDPRFEVIGVGARVDSQPTQWFSGTHEETGEFLRSLEIPKHYLVAHNTMFDGAILAWHFGIRPKYYVDTLSMARPLTGLTVGGSLKALADKFALGAKGDELVHGIGKHRLDFTPEELARYAAYCKNDVELTHLLYYVLREHVTPREMFVIDLMLRMFVDPVLQLDSKSLTEHLVTVRQKKDELLGRIRLCIEDKSTLMSNPKFAQLLRELGVEPPMKVSKTTGKPTLALAKSDPEFKALLEHENPLVQAAVSARLGMKSTLEETRTESFLQIAQRGLLPVPLSYYAAHTGRAGGTDGINLQNLPRGGALRHAIKPPPGHLLIAGDSSSIEARKVAWLANQEDLVYDFGAGVDIYSKFASEIYGRPVDRKRIEIVDGKELKPDFLPGFVGKTCILGLGYGMGKDRLHDTLKIGQGGVSIVVPVEECGKYVSLYRRKYARIPELWDMGDQALRAVANGREFEFGVNLKLLCDSEGIHLPNGMLVRYPELTRTPDGYVYKTRKGPKHIYGGKLTENVVQALARIVVFDQMCKVEQKLKPLDRPGRRHRVVLTVHDEIVICVPADFAAEAKDLMVKAMSAPPSWAESLPVACDVEVGESYGACK